MSEEKKGYGPLAIVSQAELVRILGVSLSTVQRMRRDPRFPKRRAFPGGPKGWLYREIEAFVLTAPVDDEDLEVKDNPELVMAVIGGIARAEKKPAKKVG